MYRLFNLILVIGGVFFFSCEKTSTYSDPLPCNMDTPAKRLAKTVITSILDSGTDPTSDTTSFFVNTLGQIDSISGPYYTFKVRYNSENKVSKLLQHAVGYESTTVYEYFYKNGRLSKITSPHNKSYFEWDEQGYLAQTSHEGREDITFYTNDACGNSLKVQSFYNGSKEAHYLGIAEYEDATDPHYLLGLHRVFPTDYPQHLRRMGEIVYWNCADYFSGPIKFTYEYDNEGFPIKSTTLLHVVEYFYE